MFGIEGLEDGLSRLQDELDNAILSWDKEEGEWVVILGYKTRVFSARDRDIMEAYAGAWEQLKDYWSSLQ